MRANKACPVCAANPGKVTLGEVQCTSCGTLLKTNLRASLKWLIMISLSFLSINIGGMFSVWFIVAGLVGFLAVLIGAYFDKSPRWVVQDGKR